MFCPQCGTKIEGAWTFCGGCGRSLAAPAPSLNELEQARDASDLRARRYEEEKTSVRRHVFNVLGIVAILFVAGYFALWILSNSGTSSSDNSGSPPPVANHPLGFAVKIGTDDVAVPAGQAAWFRISVKSIPLLSARLAGYFQAVGGSDDIRVLLMDQDGYTNFSNRNAFRTYYDSGKVTVDHPNIGPLAPGTYYLVFSNEYSLMTPKAIVNHMEIRYSAQ